MMPQAYALTKGASNDMVDVSPEIAKRWLDRHKYDRQRRIRQYHVNHLSNMMTRGHFRSGSPIDFAYHANKWYLVNGQHTLSALIESGETVRLNVIVHSCEGMADINKIYVTFDRQLIRTTKDTMAAHDIRGIEELRADIKGSAYAATGAASMGLAVPSHSPILQALYPWHNDQYMRAQIIESWMPELKMISNDAATEIDVGRSIVSKVGFLSVALITYRFAKDKAREFWTGIMLDDGLERGDPRKAFIRMHVSDRSSLRGQRSSRTILRQKSLYAAHAWNLFLANRQIVTLKTPTADRYIRINNTPHDGKTHLVYVDSDWNILREPVELKGEEGRGE